MKKIIFIVIVLAFVAGIHNLFITNVLEPWCKEHPNKISQWIINNIGEPKGGSYKSRPPFTANLSASNAILFDLQKGNVLFEKNSRVRCYPASTTKILTALIAIENCSLNEKFIVGDEANFPSPGSSKAGIKYGERLTMEQLLNSMLIPSGNDAAYTIAASVGRKMSKNKNLSARDSVNYFCELMNKRAKKLGAQNSKFVNPDGFHNKEHYTCAYDMGLIAQEALKHKSFKDIVCKEIYRLSGSRIIKNTNKFLLKDDTHYLNYVTGVKTGHTEEAGYCLVSTGNLNGKYVLAVVMNSTEEDVWSDSKKLMEWGMK